MTFRNGMGRTCADKRASRPVYLSATRSSLILWQLTHTSRWRMQLSVVIHRSSNFLRNNISSSPSPLLLLLLLTCFLLNFWPGDFPDVGSLEAVSLQPSLHALNICFVYILCILAASGNLLLFLHSAAVTAGCPSSSSLCHDSDEFSRLPDVHISGENRLRVKVISQFCVFTPTRVQKGKTLAGRGTGTSQHLPQEVRWKLYLRWAKAASRAAPAAAFWQHPPSWWCQGEESGHCGSTQGCIHAC